MQNGQEIFTEKGVLLTHEQYNMYQEMFAREKEHEAEILYLKQELAQLKRMIFGSKSERHIGGDPLHLSLGLDAGAVTPPEKETEQITCSRTKTDNKRGSAMRLALPTHLHREEHIIEPEEDITGARKIGEVVYVAYDIYENKEGITLFGCMAHARRKFGKAKENDPKRAEYVLERIQKLYMSECEAREKGLSFEQRKELRAEQSLPVLQQLEKWMKEQLPDVLPKSAIGQAIAYTLGLWPRLPRYTQHGQVEIDNNLVENSIRPVALGRKNYMFAGSHEAAQQAAMIYSCLGTCKINNIEPYGWLEKTLRRLPDQSIQKLDELLPC